MATLNQELIERGEAKTQEELDLSTKVKDGIRQYAITDIIQGLSSTVLQNYQSLPEETVEKTLNIFAQLIDWNELSNFESLV